MNSNALMVILKMSLTTLFGILATLGYLSHDQATSIMTDLNAIVPAVASLATIGFALYNNWNMKKVPKDSIAIAKTAVSTPDMAEAKKGDFVTVPPGATKVVGAIAFAFIVLAASSSFAQVPLPASKPTNAFLNTIKAWIAADNSAAITLATAIPELQDPIGQKCWQTFKGLGDVVTAHPLPLTLRLASDIEAARLIQMAIKKVCAEPACNQVWNDMQNQVAALAPISTPFTLTSICAKVL